MPRIPSIAPNESRELALSGESCRLPERLLLAHGKGDVLFITGAGASRPAGLPDFRELTLSIYKELDEPLFLALKEVPRGACNRWDIPNANLQPQQLAEARRFVQGDYDVALGMLERRIDQTASPSTRVRTIARNLLRTAKGTHASIHRSLVLLADRGIATTIVTTNFDLLLEDAARGLRKQLETYALSSMPRPGRSADFSGVLHIHGALDADANRSSHFVVTDRDFGEYYLQRQVIPEFIYDAARLFSLVLVGYSANDPPMRYLLNAVAADGVRFSDLKPRYAFVGFENGPDEVSLSDWRARGIEPIPYNAANNHAQLAITLSEWAKLSAVNGRSTAVDAIIQSAVKSSRELVDESQRALVDHLYRRASDVDRRKIIALMARRGATSDWLDAALSIAAETRTQRP